MPNIPSAKRFGDTVEEARKDSSYRRALKAGDEAVVSYGATHFDGVNEGLECKDQAKPMNLTFRGANVLVAHLGANAPKHEIKAKRVQLKGEAMLHSLRFDYLNTDLDRVWISRRSLLNTLLRGRTVTRVGLRAGGELVKLYGHSYDPGQPFLKIVPNHNHLYDVTAPCRKALRWESEKYVVPRGRLMDSGIFRRDLVEKIRPIEEQETTDAQMTGQMLGNSRRNELAYIEPMIELMDVYFYDADGAWTMATLPANPAEISDYLTLQSVEPVDEGYFIWEEFYPSPKDEIDSVSWGAMTMVQTLIASRLMNKIVDLASNCKRLIFASMGTTPKEIEAIMKSADGDIIQVQDSQAYKDIVLSGQIPDVVNLLGHVERWWNIQAGQIDELSGSGAGDKTATQSSADTANAQTIMGHLKRIHLETEEKRSRALANLIINDPQPAASLAMKLKGGEIVQLPYSPLEMRGSVSDFEYKISASSMPAQDANVVLRRLIEFLGLPFVAPVANPQAAARTFGKKAGVEDLDEIVPDPAEQWLMNNAMNTVQGLPPAPPPGAPPMGPGAPAGPGAMGRSGPQMRPVDAVRSAMSNRVPV